MPSYTFSVFTKPWKMPIPELARYISSLGFDAVELPVRPGYPVNPENIAALLPDAARILADHGLKIASIAGPTDELAVAACEAAGVPIIRICINIPKDRDYLSAVEDLQREWDALIPTLARHGVTLGLQNHSGRSIANAMQIHHAIAQYDPMYIAAVWDAAHNALQGENVELALDIVGPHLCMVNLKNAYWQLATGPEALSARWQAYWTTGPHGLAPWPQVATELKKRNWSGVICLSAEYSDEGAVDRLIPGDLAYAKGLLA